MLLCWVNFPKGSSFLYYLFLSEEKRRDVCIPQDVVQYLCTTVSFSYKSVPESRFYCSRGKSTPVVLYICKRKHLLPGSAMLNSTWSQDDVFHILFWLCVTGPWSRFPGRHWCGCHGRNTFILKKLFSPCHLSYNLPSMCVKKHSSSYTIWRRSSILWNSLSNLVI